MKTSALLLLLSAVASPAAVANALDENSSFSLGDSDGGKLPNGGKIWAVLVAGSNGWWNYRHQADVCHSYQVLRSHGIPDDQIVVMMYDDIANNVRNKDPGVIINRPDGPNVYKGVPKDYTGKDVTPENFLHVLKGEADKVPAGKKVLKSGPKDNVFVYFADHGAPGLIAFPWAKDLKASQLGNATKQMYEQKRFNKLVYYVEACESGSMFDKRLPNDWNVYATTATNDVSSSYACYLDARLGTYLGDVYSIKWLQDSDREDLDTETLERQFEIVKEETTTSPVHEFGDLDVAKLPVGDFQGLAKRKDNGGDLYDTDACVNSAVDNKEANRIALETAFKTAKTKEDKARFGKLLRRYVSGQRRLVRAVLRIVALVTEGDDSGAAKAVARGRHAVVRDEPCYEAAVDAFTRHCRRHALHDYRTAVLYMFANLCNAGFKADSIEDAARVTCGASLPNITIV